MQEKMQLRTVYLSGEIDSKLRLLAFRLKISKGELMRQLLQNGVEPILDNVESASLEEIREKLKIHDTSATEELVEA